MLCNSVTNQHLCASWDLEEMSIQCPPTKYFTSIACIPCSSVKQLSNQIFEHRVKQMEVIMSVAVRCQRCTLAFRLHPPSSIFVI